MKNTVLILGLATVLSGTLPAQAKLNVVATLPDYGAIAEEVGGDKISVTTIARGTEDQHFVDARPSYVRVLNKADVLIEGGAELEVGWLPPLVSGARNPKILSDAPGHIILSRHIRLLEVPTGPVDRSMGDVHPFGNPHFTLDPANGKIIASTLAEAFGRVDSANAAFYQDRSKAFIERLDKKLAEWAKLMEPYRGTKVVTYHKSFDYFVERFGLDQSGDLVGQSLANFFQQARVVFINGLGGAASFSVRAGGRSNKCYSPVAFLGNGMRRHPVVLGTEPEPVHRDRNRFLGSEDRDGFLGNC